MVITFSIFLVVCGILVFIKTNRVGFKIIGGVIVVVGILLALSEIGWLG